MLHRQKQRKEMRGISRGKGEETNGEGLGKSEIEAVTLGRRIAH